MNLIARRYQIEALKDLIHTIANSLKQSSSYDNYFMELNSKDKFGAMDHVKFTNDTMLYLDELESSLGKYTSTLHKQDLKNVGTEINKVCEKIKAVIVKVKSKLSDIINSNDNNNNNNNNNNDAASIPSSPLMAKANIAVAEFANLTAKVDEAMILINKLHTSEPKSEFEIFCNRIECNISSSTLELTPRQLNSINDEFVKILSEHLYLNVNYKSLVLEGDDLTDASISSLEKCFTNLHTVSITAKQLTETSAVSLVKDNNLTDIQLCGDNFDNNFITKLATKKQIRKFSLTCNQFPIDGIKAMLSNINLIELKIHCHGLNDDILKGLEEDITKSHIKKLVIKSDNLSNEAIKTLSNLPNLEELIINGTHIDSIVTNHFMNNMKLAGLYINHNEQDSFGSFQYFSHHLSDSHPNKQLYKQYLLMLSDEIFIKHVVSSKEMVRLVLNDKSLCDKLDTLDLPKDRQTFENSCAARSIMMFLFQSKMLLAHEMTRSYELELYSQIWQNPGKEADITLVIDHLQKISEKNYDN